MRRLLKWFGRVVLALALAALVVGLWKREEITRLLAVQSLFSAEKIVSNFSNMNKAFLTRPIPRGDGPVSPLPMGPEADLPPEIEDWIAARAVTSLLVLDDGQIVHESYHLGTGPEDLRIGWSIAKSFVSALFGIVQAEGKIGALDDPVTKYAPVLTGSAYDGVTIRQVLQMTSGVQFDEDYLDYHSDINKMGRVLALGGSMDGFAAGLDARASDPGDRWKYVSIDTHVVAMVIRGATGRDLPDLLAEKIIAPLGLQAAPYVLTDGRGVAFALGGLNLTTRDYARFGLMFAQGGQWQGQQIVPADWVAASTTASAPTAPGKIRYGYQWWIPKGAPDGIFMARGIYGQYIYIDRPRGVVIVTTAADRLFREPGVNDDNVAMFRAIALAVAPD
ncbi:MULTISPECIES: serine hydrolase [unclassified Roseovarius]|uniref:serine hydrolase domain-containing protein n=1 Tax=unclassified Roseovarius TaxID=2614913 RepID=UPI00273DDEDD|nr:MULTISPECIES: serine hydrolase [unclassified Roseovarius]